MESNNNDHGKWIRNILLFAGIPLLIILVSWMVLSSNAKKDDRTFSEYIGYFEKGEVSFFDVDLNDNTLKLLLREEAGGDTNKDGVLDERDYIKYQLPSFTLFYDSVSDIITEANNDDNPDNDIKFDAQAPQEIPWFLSMLPSLLIVVFVIIMVVMMRRLPRTVRRTPKIAVLLDSVPPEV